MEPAIYPARGHFLCPQGIPGEADPAGRSDPLVLFVSGARPNLRAAGMGRGLFICTLSAGAALVVATGDRPGLLLRRNKPLDLVVCPGSLDRGLGIARSPDQ